MAPLPLLAQQQLPVEAARLELTPEQTAARGPMPLTYISADQAEDRAERQPQQRSSVAAEQVASLLVAVAAVLMDRLTQAARPARVATVAMALSV